MEKLTGIGGGLMDSKMGALFNMVVVVVLFVVVVTALGLYLFPELLEQIQAIVMSKLGQVSGL